MQVVMLTIAFKQLSSSHSYICMIMSVHTGSWSSDAYKKVTAEKTMFTTYVHMYNIYTTANNYEGMKAVLST